MPDTKRVDGVVKQNPKLNVATKVAFSAFGADPPGFRAKGGVLQAQVWQCALCGLAACMASCG